MTKWGVSTEEYYYLFSSDNIGTMSKLLTVLAARALHLTRCMIFSLKVYWVFVLSGDRLAMRSVILTFQH